MNEYSKHALNDFLKPDEDGYFGVYGGQIEHPELNKAMRKIQAGFDSIKKDAAFKQQIQELMRDYVGRPSPIYHAANLSQLAANKAQIYLKREDLNHSGAHKINHCLGEALLAKKLGFKKVIAETGAGQHGVALATAAALMGLECEIHMGVVDIEKEHPNVSRMKVLGAKIVPVTFGQATLKEAVDSAFDSYLKQLDSSMFAIGSVVGPAPYPEMIAYFQSIVGHEARHQFLTKYGKLPTEVVACVGGGSNAMGIFNAFLEDEAVKLVGVEPAGEGLDSKRHAATLTLGKMGYLQGFHCYLLQDEDGQPAAVHSVASGLDYPGVGPQHCLLKDCQKARYEAISDQEALAAFLKLSRHEGIIPALESAHALAYALKRAPKLAQNNSILVNLSGRGDKDIDFAIDKLKL